jgi:hypothetical protein
MGLLSSVYGLRTLTDLFNKTRLGDSQSNSIVVSAFPSVRKSDTFSTPASSIISEFLAKARAHATCPILALHNVHVWGQVPVCKEGPLVAVDLVATVESVLGAEETSIREHDSNMADTNIADINIADINGADTNIVDSQKTGLTLLITPGISKIVEEDSYTPFVPDLPFNTASFPGPEAAASHNHVRIDSGSHEMTADKSAAQPERRNFAVLEPRTDETSVPEDLLDGDSYRPGPSITSSDSSLDGSLPCVGNRIVDSKVLRADWEPIIAISPELFHEVLLKHLPVDHGIVLEDIQSVKEAQGGFHFVRILKVPNGPQAGRYVVKVPCTGTAARWQDSDAYMLHNQARTMSYIFENTAVLLPEVLGYDDSLQNGLTAPYIMMRAVDGVPAYQLWFDRDEDDDDEIEFAHVPEDERVPIRETFLRDLAHIMAELRAL